MGKIPKPLLLILAGFTLLTILYGRLIPPFEGPDGPEHFAYITWLAEGRGFPPQGAAAWDTPVRQEAGQPPLYYLLAAVPARIVGVNNPPAVYRPNPHFPSTAPGTVADNKNRAIHDPADSWPLRGGWLALYLARGVSLAFGLLLVATVYGLAQEFSPGNRGLALGAAGLVAATPQVLFLSSVESNDMAAAATSGLTLWLLARLIRRGLTPGRALALGAAFGLALLTKVSTLVLVFPIVIALAYCVLRIAYSDSPNTQYAIRNKFHASGITLYALLATVLIAGWWFGRSWLVYGTPFGLDTHDYAPWAITESAARSPALSEWVEVFYSYWAAFGWGNIKFHGWVYGILALLCVTAVAGLVRSNPFRGKTAEAVTTNHIRDSGIIALTLILTILGVTAALELWMQRVTAPHGRLLFPAAAAIAVLLAAGWQAVHRWLLWGGVGVVAGLAILSPLLLIRPAYAVPRPLTAGEAGQEVGTRLDWRFGEIAELVGVTVLEPSVAASGVLPIRFCWQVLAPAERDYSVFVQLIGPGDGVVASRRTYPGLGNYPTSSWRPGMFFCEVVRVDIPAGLGQTLLYKVEVGLVDQISGERLAAYDNQGTDRSDTFAGTVRLVAASETIAETPAGSDPIRLADFQVDNNWRPGQSYDVTLDWWLAEPVQTDYTVYLHLRDPATDELVSQADGPPLDGWYPTTVWTAGEMVTDHHTFLLPDSVPAGHYHLITGWYDTTTGQRMGSEHYLATIEVAP